MRVTVLKHCNKRLPIFPPYLASLAIVILSEIVSSPKAFAATSHPGSTVSYAIFTSLPALILTGVVANVFWQLFRIFEVKRTDTIFPWQHNDEYINNLRKTRKKKKLDDVVPQPEMTPGLFIAQSIFLTCLSAFITFLLVVSGQVAGALSAALTGIACDTIFRGLVDRARNSDKD